MKSLNGFLTATATVIAFGVAGNAGAAAVERVFSTWAPGLCQAALPAFEGQIRKRPMAVQNEGTSNAFVTCAFTQQSNTTGSPANWFWTTQIRIDVQNLGATQNDISCTGVFQDLENFTTWYVVKSVTLAPGAVSGLYWIGQDFGQLPLEPMPGRLFSASCNLRPGIGLTEAHVYFGEDVGA